MKIVHVSNYYPGVHDHVGGAEQACRRTVLLSLSRGYDMCVATTRWDHSPEPQLSAGERVEALPRCEQGLPQRVRTYAEAVKWYSVQRDPLAARAFRRLIERERPDVVHFHNFQFLTFDLLREAKRAGAATCLSIYDYWVFCPKAQLLRPDKTFCEDAHGEQCLDCLPAQFRSVQRALLRRRRGAFDEAFELVDRFVVLSEHSAVVLENYGIPNERISIVPLSLPLDYEDAGGAETPELEHPALLFAGWLNDRKGVHVAIEAMPRILDRFPEAVLYVVGGRAKFAEEYEHAYERFIANNGLSDRIRFLGHLQPDEVRGFLKEADVLLVPEQYANMSPLIIIEAMVLGTPVVASKLGGIPEYVRHEQTGLLANAYDPEEFADAAYRLLSDPSTSEGVTARAREFIHEHNGDAAVWEATMKAYNGAQQAAAACKDWTSAQPQPSPGE